MNFFITQSDQGRVVVACVLMTTSGLPAVDRAQGDRAHPAARRSAPRGSARPAAAAGGRHQADHKEDMLPSHVNKVFYFLAPFIAVIFALHLDLGDSVRPDHQRSAGVTTGDAVDRSEYRRAVHPGHFRLGVYGVALAGWASNNKYALMGGLRSSAQMISYELPMALAIAAPLLMLNTLSLREIVERAGGLLLRLHPALDHLPDAVPADLQLHPVSDRRLRRNQPRAVRSAGSRKRTGGRIPHRIRQHEVRVVLHGRVRQHGDGLLRRDAAVPGRLASAVPRRIRLGSDSRR